MNDDWWMILFSEGKNISSSPKHPTLLWGPHSTLQGLFPLGQKGLYVKLTTHSNLAPRLRQIGLYFHSHKTLRVVHGENFIILFA